MKVIKRDGRIVEYDKSKIVVAIEKANNEVEKPEKATKGDINKIIKYIEKLNKKRILVEDIQDIIELKLMELGKYELAKKYIVYRYTRALIRKSNTTDASILGLIRNGNRTESKDTIMASTQRNLVVGEVSKDLTKRILLPEKISKAWEEGILYFHDAEYFIQPIINSCNVNMQDMLDNGTVINDNMIETPKTFRMACNLMTQIISAVASNQYGEQYVDVSCLGKYLRKSSERIKTEVIEEVGNDFSKEKIEEMVSKRAKRELSAGIQTIQYQINTLMTTTGKSPNVTVYLHLKQNDEYIKENAIIIEEILKQRIAGMKNEKGEYITPKYPKLAYVLNGLNCLNGGEYDYLTEFALECSSKRKYPDFVSDKYNFNKGFNQGIVSINLPQIALTVDENEKEFWDILDERLELCKEALMCRHYALLGTSTDISPIHWIYGAISRLEKGQKINNLLYGDNSNLYLGYIGLCETVNAIKGMEGEESEKRKFANKVLEYLKNKTTQWKKETNVNFLVYEVSEDKICQELLEIDKDEFGIVEGVTDKESYTNLCDINLPEFSKNFDEMKDIIQDIYDKGKYIEFKVKALQS